MKNNSRVRFQKEATYRVVIKNVNYKLEVNGSNTGSQDDPINDPIKLSKNEQAVIDVIMINPNLTRKEMAEKLECSDSTVKRAIEGLVKKEFLKEKDLEKAEIGLFIYNRILN